MPEVYLPEGAGAESGEELNNSPGWIILSTRGIKCILAVA